MLRHFNYFDIPVLEKMLIDEGFTKSQMEFNSGVTFVFEEDKIIKGFFTFKLLSHRYLTLLHFCTEKEYRTPKLARLLTKHLINKIKNFNADKCIIDCPIKNKGLSRIIEYYFKTKPYAEKNGYKYYLVGV